MQDFPSAEDLLDAVAAYLFAELRPQAPKEERFKVLVAANVCAVVARELRTGGAGNAEDAELFSGLLGEEGADTDPDSARGLAEELAAGIRSGKLDDSLQQLIERLPEHVRRKLDVARPGYAD